MNNTEIREYFQQLATKYEETKENQTIIYQFLNKLTYNNTNQEINNIYNILEGIKSDPIDEILGYFNELDENDQEEAIYCQLENLLDKKIQQARKEMTNDNGYYNIKLKVLKKEIENIENILEKLNI